MASNLKHKTKVGLYWSLFNQGANFSMQFVIGIVMARLLTPSDFGITALPAVFIAVANVFIESGFSQALVRKQDLNDEDLSTAFYYSALVGVLMYVVMFFASPFIADFYGEPVLVKLLRITSLLFIISPLNTPQNVILKQRLDFKTPARISIINKIISGILGVTAAYIGYGLWALVIASLSSSILGVIQTCAAVRWYPKALWNKDSFKYLWGYGNKLIGTHFLNQLYANVTPIVLGKFGGTVQLGYYNRAKQYAAMPNNIITGMLTTVTFPVLSRVNEDRGKLERSYRKMIRVSAFIMFPIMMYLAGLARPIIILMLTSKWEASIYLLQIMCFTYMWQPVQILNLNVIQIVGRTDLSLKLELIKKPIGLLFIMTGLSISVVGLCYADLAYTFVALFFNSYYTKKLVNVGIGTQLRDILPTLLISLIMFGAVFMITFIVDSLWLQIIYGTIVGVVVFFGLSYIFKLPELQELQYLLNRKA